MKKGIVEEKLAEVSLRIERRLEEIQGKFESFLERFERTKFREGGS
jgi:hypothetical protein